MFIPGMLPIWFLFAEFFCAGAFFLLDDALRRCIPDIFIPGMFIPGMLPMSCVFAVCFFLVAFLFFRSVAFDLDFAFGLLIPGIFDMSCWAKTGTLATTSTAANKSAHTVTRELKLNVSMLFIIPLESSSSQKSL
ncbi:MAG TPA: hypothetical protein DCK93_22450 [Blastocatellia bacterium]|nr:hypothetical protein [Blastocatellia bacterium]HAF25633.1 hypothetical protein [Blastocatellia bacterium]